MRRTGKSAVLVACYETEAQQTNNLLPMPMSKPNYSDLIAVIVIVVLALFTALVCFGILDSAAQGTLKEYSVSGALAGALVSASLFTSIYLQIRKASESQRALQREVEELRLKLLRSKVPPQGFTIEVDERRKIVFARPRAWGPYGGKLFNYGLRLDDVKEYKFPGHCEVLYLPIPETLPTAGSYYSSVTRHLEGNPKIVQSTFDMVNIGNEDNSIRALKVSGVQYVRFRIELDEITSQPDFHWDTVTEKEYLDGKDKIVEFGRSGKIQYVTIKRNQLYCYHEGLGTIFMLRCLDVPEHWSETSETFNRISESIGFLS